MVNDNDYEVIWDGTRDRQGTCPSLVSPLHGASSLTYTAPDRWADGEVTRQEPAPDHVGRTVGLSRRTEAQRARRDRERLHTRRTAKRKRAA